MQACNREMKPLVGLHEVVSRLCASGRTDRSRGSVNYTNKKGDHRGGDGGMLLMSMFLFISFPF